MKTASRLVLSAVFFLSTFCPAQNSQSNLREIYESGISLDIGGVAFGGASFDTYLSSRLNLELSVGVIAGVGLNYHFKGDDPDDYLIPGICYRTVKRTEGLLHVG